MNKIETVCIFGAVMLLNPVGASAVGNCIVNDIRILEHGPTEILPGEPIIVVLEVDAECSTVGDGGAARSRIGGIVTRQVSKRLEIDGEVFLNRLSGGPAPAYLNDAADFAPLPRYAQKAVETQQSVSDNLYTIRCVASVFLKYLRTEDRVLFAFRSPGVHVVTFGHPDGAQITLSITVKEPTRQERDICRSLERMDILLFLARLEDRHNCTPDVLDTMASLLTKYPDTAYPRYLSLAVGVGKYYELRRDRVEELQERDRKIMGLGQYFDRALPDTHKVVSEFDVAALWYKGVIERLHAKYASSKGICDKHLDNFKGLSKEILDSPASARYWAGLAAGHERLSTAARTAFLRQLSGPGK